MNTIRLNLKNKILFYSLFFIICFLLSSYVFANVRIKDIAKIDGVRENQLIGYGLVVGLAGTGDDTGNAAFTIQSIVSMLEHLGVSINVDTTKVDNIAAVLVTATLPPFVKAGTKIDVLLSSIGDSKSLKGGTLVMTPLMGADKNIYAVAQGSVSIGGMTDGGHLTVAKIPGGAIIERETDSMILKNNKISISLNYPDFTSAIRMEKEINKKYKNIAKAKDGATIDVIVPPRYIKAGRIVEFISTIECLSITPDTVSQIIINERSGTIIAGENISISKIAIAHGNLSITIKNQILEPVPQRIPEENFEEQKDILQEEGEDAPPILPTKIATVEEQEASLMIVETSIKISEVARALNILGVTPKDMVSILQAMRESGALQADIKII